MNVKKILVIRIRRVGDAIIGTSLCTTLKKTFPEAEIHYLLNSHIASLYENHPDIDKALKIDRPVEKNIFRHWFFVKSLLKDHQYDVIIDMRGTTKTLLFSLLSRKTPFRIGPKKFYSFVGLNYPIKDIYTKSNSMIEQNFELLDPLKTIAKIQYHAGFNLYITDEERKQYKEYMQSKGIDFSKPVILASVTTRIASKMWEMSKMKGILFRILDQFPQTQIVLNHVKEEYPSVAKLYHDMGNHQNVFTNIEAHSLRQLCALSANCDFFFGNEGGTRHLTQAMNIPSFAIYPPNISKTKWLPQPWDRFAGISPDDFLSAEEQKTMTYEERFNLINEDNLWQQLEPMLKRFLPNR